MDDRFTVGGLEVRILARRTRDADAVYTRSCEKIDQPVQRAEIDLPVAVDRRGDRRKETRDVSFQLPASSLQLPASSSQLSGQLPVSSYQFRATGSS
jgi:hypothetical protein